MISIHSFQRWTLALMALSGTCLVAACSDNASAPPSSATASAAPAVAVQPNASPSALQTTAVNCQQNNDLPCAEANWTQYIKLRPMDTRAIANLGFVLNHEDKDPQAIAQFEKDISMGEGTYDIFAYYADSLAKVGRTDEAIDWSYKTLKIEPSLVDVRGKLSKLLVMKQRNYEALALLAEFDQYLDTRGQQPYFTGDRMAIESALHDGMTKSGETKGIRMEKLDGTFYAPVSVGESGTRAFVVDTGATEVLLNDDFLVASKAPYKIVRAHVIAKLADGREVEAKEVMIDHMLVGPIEVDNVKAMSCGQCELLLGEDALSRFNMNMTQVQGVDVATLAPNMALQSGMGAGSGSK
jgi:predicted aspartyl protease